MANLHTEQLEYLLNELSSRSEHVNVLGVFPANCVPQVTRGGACDSCFILNTDHHGLPGTHWLAFYYISGVDKLEYFDSYGLPLSSYPSVLSAFTRRNFNIVRVNKFAMQSLFSSACGYYCVLYLHLRSWRGSSVASIDFIRKLASLCDARDAKVVSTMHLLMHKFRCCNMPDAEYCTRYSQSCACRREK